MLTSSAPAAILPRGRAQAFAVRVARDWDAARDEFEGACRDGAGTAFQSWPVLDAWYRAFSARPGLEPLLVAVSDAGTGARVAHLPLVLLRERGTRVIAFADHDLIDYNAPILGAGAPVEAQAARAMWRAVRRALPAADLVDLRKMPPRIGGRPNPLALLGTRPSRLNGNVVRTGDSYDAYMRGGIKRVVRKELERSWRVFTRHPGAVFRVVTGAEERLRVLATLEGQQAIRMGLAGQSYSLDEPEPTAYYRRLVASDPDGAVVGVYALLAGDEVVAALVGLREAGRLTMIRIGSSADPAWTNASPGRLVIERTMAHLHAEGIREFDFSVGNFDYKRRFGVEPLPLVDLMRPLTPLGLPRAAHGFAMGWLRRHPAWEARLRRALRRPPVQESTG